MKYLAIWLVAMNAAGMLAVALDKRRARRGTWRVPERTLFVLCVLGACPGVYCAMRTVRHKTLHKRFMLGIPAIFVLQIVIICGILYFLHRGV